MQKLKAQCIGITVDGFAAGPDQSLDNPLGVRGGEIMSWFFPTKFFKQMHGDGTGGTTGVDNTMAERSFDNMGAWILGRNMFGPVRGPWPDDTWKGWWGEEPPYHVPTFILTHHARDPIEMKGGTTFYFVTDGIESALEQAMAAAKGKDVRVGGGPSTIRQYMQAKLLDELHLAVRPVVLGRGERLWEGMDASTLGYEVAETIQGENATHMFLRKNAASAP